MTIRGIHHITILCTDLERTVRFYRDLLGLRLIKQTVNYDDPGTRHFYLGDEAGTPGTVLTFFEYPGMPHGELGAGSTHHFALLVDDDAAQRTWRDKLVEAGIPVTPVVDRTYFRSIYFQDPDGHIVEIATRGPGFAVDEPADGLGEQLILPGWLTEADAAGIRAGLHAEDRLRDASGQIVLRRFTGGPAATNAYLVGDREAKEAIAIDPAKDTAELLLEAAADLGLTIALIVNTHGHWDHIAENALLKEKTGAPLAVHPADAGLLAQPSRAGGELPFPIPPTTPDRELKAGEVLSVGALRLRVVETPGHSPGGICLHDTGRDLLISGDAVFANGYGRTDIPGASESDLRESLKKLTDLPIWTEVFPGHGRATSIGREQTWLRRFVRGEGMPIEPRAPLSRPSGAGARSGECRRCGSSRSRPRCRGGRSP